MTDAVAVRMGIRNANCVIHYEFPEGKNAFGNRLHTMLDIMKKQVNLSSSICLIKICHEIVNSSS